MCTTSTQQGKSTYVRTRTTTPAVTSALKPNEQAHSWIEKVTNAVRRAQQRGAGEEERLREQTEALRRKIAELEAKETHAKDTRESDDVVVKFNTVFIEHAMRQGFPRPMVLDCIMSLHLEGKPPANEAELICNSFSFRFVSFRFVSFRFVRVLSVPAALNRMPKTEQSEEARKIEAEHELEEANECKVCMATRREVLLVPCGHFCMCRECAIQLTSRFNGSCPICRSTILSTVRVFE